MLLTNLVNSLSKDSKKRDGKPPCKWCSAAEGDLHAYSENENEVTPTHTSFFIHSLMFF